MYATGRRGRCCAVRPVARGASVVVNREGATFHGRYCAFACSIAIYAFRPDGGGSPNAVIVQPLSLPMLSDQQEVTVFAVFYAFAQSSLVRKKPERRSARGVPLWVLHIDFPTELSNGGRFADEVFVVQDLQGPSPPHCPRRTSMPEP